MKRIKKSGPNVLGVEALQGDDGCTGVKVNTADGYADYLFSATDMQAHHPSKRVSFCGGLGLIREKRRSDSTDVSWLWPFTKER